jgi:hypothetical protein
MQKYTEFFQATQNTRSAIIDAGQEPNSHTILQTDLHYFLHPFKAKRVRVNTGCILNHLDCSRAIRDAFLVEFFRDRKTQQKNQVVKCLSPQS